MFCCITVFHVSIVLSVFGLTVCQDYVCLKAFDLEDKIQLNCTVDKLNFDITFLNPLGEVYGRCHSITKQCESNMSQDKNTTSVLMKKTAKIDGVWTCNHGTNRGSDSVVVNTQGKTCLDGQLGSNWKGVSIGLIVIDVIIVVVVLVIVVSRYDIRAKLEQWRRKGPEYQPINDKTDEDTAYSCSACTLASVCAICADCKKMYCEICCDTHSRSEPDHKVCEIDHVVTSNIDIKCGSCKNKPADHVCMTCISELCAACYKHHKEDEKKHVIKHLVLTTHSDGSRKRQDTEHESHINYKYTIETKTEPNSAPPRICGLCFITDGRIVVSEYHHKQLQIYRNVSLLITYNLGQEPKGMTRLQENMIAITYPYERQIKLYKINEKSVREVRTLNLPDKPFSIAYDNPNFAVEMGEGDDGVIVIVDTDGNIIHRITNETAFAYFTSNTIRLALDSNNRKVFVAALSKKSVACVDFAGNILWRKRVPSPRSIVFLGHISTERNMIIASKRWNLIFSMNSADGQNDIIMSSGRVRGPRYMDYNLDQNLLCIQVDDGTILVYNISDIKYLRSDSTHDIKS